MSRHFPDFITAYLDTFTPRGEAPERFHFWCAVSTIGAVLRRRVYIDEGTFRWFPNFYIVLVGPPGTVKKSTTIGVGARMIREVPNVHIGADCSTWQKFVEEVAQAQDLFAEGDPTDMSEDALLEQQHVVSCAITLTISELGTFLRPDDPEMVNILTELWDCKLDTAFRKATKTQGDDVLMNPFVNIIAGTTPKWMADNFRGRFGGWGFSSRCIFLHCSRPERLIAYPHTVWRDTHAATQQRFVDDLREIAKLQGEYKLSADAEAYGTDWYDAHMRRKMLLDDHPQHDPWLSYYLARKFDHAHKLALVLAASRRDTPTITLGDLQDATARCDEIEEELAQIFSSRESTNRDAKLNMDVWKGLCNGIVKSGGSLHRRDLYAFTIQFMTGGRAKDLVGHLVSAGWLAVESNSQGEFYSFGSAAQIPDDIRARMNGDGGVIIPTTTLQPEPHKQ